MSDRTELNLNAIRFTEQPVTILDAGGMRVRAFRYATGVKAVTITTPRGEVTILPFKGQQVWRAAFDGRELAMKSMFDEPQATTDYLGTYGAYLIHCGIAAMGGPPKTPMLCTAKFPMRISNRRG
jgi:hypothetical protein